MVSLFIFAIISGSVIVLWSSSPYYSVLGVLLQSLGYCFFLCFFGFPFFGLIFLLVYVGGMMVVFLFSTVLSAERYLNSSILEVLFFLFSFNIIILPYLEFLFPWIYGFSFLSLSKEIQVCELMGSLMFLTCLVAFILFVSLLVVFSLCFEHGRVSLRKL
uniref:NADH-ubiquinone oxidoreductase chain 6 n=1 Tax=Astrospartus mediterraneus TaxID=691888 RepID=D3H5Y6_ASTMD|nr:NADH dehydrogenase subunit 6 [Astrospartus mediterraneus]CBH40160.1 NADH dehydrogenase subunit 6 [Astrospartus mediterraneus]